MIVFISCVKTKNNKPCRADQMYKSTLFKITYKFARCITNGRIIILSAKYGALDVDEYIEPYELCLNQLNKAQRKQWANKVISQLERKNICPAKTKAIFLCSKDYYSEIIDKFALTITPLKNLSIGKRIQYMQKYINRKEK